MLCGWVIAADSDRIESSTFVATHPKRFLPLPTDLAKAVAMADDAYAPTVVGVPPCAAVRDLCVTADGEIRHYGKTLVGGKVTRIYRASRDGFEWTTHRAAENDVGAMVRSPWSGDWIYFTGMDPVTLVRSKTGPGDMCAERSPMPWTKRELRRVLPRHLCERRVLSRGVGLFGRGGADVDADGPQACRRRGAAVGRRSASALVQ